MEGIYGNRVRVIGRRTRERGRRSLGKYVVLVGMKKGWTYPVISCSTAVRLQNLTL